jgi:hypothetical protein
MGIFLVCIVKEKLTGLGLNHGSPKETWGGVTKIAAGMVLAADLLGRLESCKKRFNLRIANVKKL